MEKFNNETLKNVMSQEDFNQWMKYQEKGKRLGEIIQNPKASRNYKADAAAGIKKLGNAKRRLLKKYGMN